MNKNWFTRFEQKSIDPRYLKNIIEATNYFQSWFSGKHAASFTDMLTTMHRLAIRGGYIGHTATDGPVVPLGSAFRGVNKGAWRPLLKKKWFTEVLVYADSNIYPTIRLISLRGTHHLVERETGYELHLPREDCIPDFLWRMQTIMEGLRCMFSAELLAEYIQLFVVGHPFEKVNYSICMAQVNAILDYYGYKPLLHQWFDFDCFVYDYDRIEEIFETRLTCGISI